MPASPENIGLFDAAHILAPVPIASSLGLGHIKVPIAAPFNLGINGNAITVSPALHAAMMEEIDGDRFDPLATAKALAKVVAKRRKDDPRCRLGTGGDVVHETLRLRGSPAVLAHIGIHNSIYNTFAMLGNPALGQTTLTQGNTPPAPATIVKPRAPVLRGSTRARSTARTARSGRAP